MAGLAAALTCRSDTQGARDDALRVFGRNAALEFSVAALNLHNAVTRMNGIAAGN
ncbi:hypothetical protein [Nocardia abscessus]|uniref:hypothetical protein n=1 Tax=Nocardia abscessus TaxID=120957 RepID=UPI002456C532|nr:hypothetical protein [Nocardia abscessus]